MSAFAGFFQQSAIALARWFLRNKNLGTLLQTYGAIIDDAAETLAQGARFSQPLRCDTSALPALAKDRSIELFATEAEASQRTRLAQWKQLARQRGSARGEMNELAIYFGATFGVVPTMRIVHQDGTGSIATWHTRGGNDDGFGISKPTSASYVQQVKVGPSNWNWDGAFAKWSRLWLIIYTSGFGFTPPDWDGGGDWDGGPIWDGTFTDTQIADIVSIFRNRKGAHSILWGVIAATDPASFNPAASIIVNGDGTSTLPDGKWGYTVDPVTGKPTRVSTARFLYDLGHG